MIANDVEEIPKIRERLHAPKHPLLMKTVNIYQGLPTMIMKQNDALSVTSCPVVCITMAAIWRDAPGVHRD